MQKENLSPSQKIYLFLKGEGVDEEGRNIKNVWRFNADQLENTHNYIQWIFPLREWSEQVPGAPYLEQNEIDLIKKDELVQDNIMHSLYVMEKFYSNNDFWLCKGNHNHYRISRIIKSTKLLNSDQNANEFYKIILDKVEQSMPVTFESLSYWEKSLGLK